MLPPSQRVAFLLFTLLTVTLGVRGFYRVYRRVACGRPDADRRTNHLVERTWYAIKTTLLQERVFRRRPVVGIFHSFIFFAFVLYLLVNLVDAIEGFVELSPIVPSPAKEIYGALTDLFSVLAIVGVLALVLRRYFLPGRRDFSFNQSTLLHDNVRQGYVRRDSAIVSVFIVLHVGSRIIGNAAKMALEGQDRAQPFASLLSDAFVGPHAMAWRIFGYWGALGSILLFLLYFPYSKHIHLLMAPVKYFLRRDGSSGELPAVKIDLEAADPAVGAAQVADLAWPRLLDAYACIQCNRCQDVCPASQTGKSLSPAALEINKRMVLNKVDGGFERGTSAGPALLESVISAEAVWGCTTCGACMEVCPTQDEQMLDIIDIRRNLVMLQGQFPTQLQSAFRGMERNSNPWAMPRDKRMAWAESLRVPTIDEVEEPDVLYWVGCAASYDPAAQKTARAVVNLLTESNVNFAVLGKRECCTGDSARRAGNELLYQELATTAIATLQAARPKLVVASCPHCVNVIGNEYPQLGGHFRVVHHTEYLDSMLKDGRLKPKPTDGTVTFHDPCYLGRHRGTYEQPRSVLKVLGAEYIELPRARSNAFCCGAGGAQFWKEEERGAERISENRFREVQAALTSATGDKVLAVGCPFCKSMLQSTPSAGQDSSIVIKDVAELLWEGVQRSKGLETAATLERAAEVVPTEQTLLEAESFSAQSAGDEKGSDVEAGSGAAFASNDVTPTMPVERKNWTPKSTTPASAALKPENTGLGEGAPPAETERAPESIPPARKKWKPGAKE